MPTLTLDEFLPKARELNPDYSDDELIQAYQDRYGTRPTQTVSSAPLMTLNEFLPKARKLNPAYSDEELTAAWQEKYGARGAREQDQGDLGRGFKESFQQVPQMAAGVAAGLGAYGEKLFGEGGLSTALKNTGIKNYREIEQDISRDSKPSDSLTEAYNMARSGDAGALVDWLQHGLGYVGGQGLQALATAGIGSIAGKMMLRPAAETLAQKMIAKESARLAATGIAGDQLKRQAVSNVAGKIGQIAALGTAATAMEGGEIHGDLVSQAEQEGRALSGKDLAIAFATTLGAGALEFVGDKLGLDLILGRSVASRLANSRLGNATISGTAGAVVEAGTEAAQTPLEQIGKGQDPRSPESIKETVDSAALGGLGGAALGAGGGLARRPEGDELQVTDRTPPERKALPAPPIYGEGPVYTPTGPVEAVVPGKGRLAGLGPGTVEQYDGEVMPDMGARRLTQAPQPGEYRNGTVYGGGDVVDVSPLPDITPVTKASSLDEAIANAVGVVQGATETAQARAAEFARMTAKAKNETDALLANAPEKRTAFTVPTLPGPEAQPPTLLNQPSPIVPGQAFTPRSEPIDDPRARLAEERARMVAQREQQRLTQQANPVSAPVDPARSVQPAEEGLLPSQLDLAYPSSNQVRDLIHEKGLHLDTPVFKEILRQVVKKESFADLTPQELQRLADRIQTIKAPQQPTQAQEAPPQVPLTPAKKPEKPYAPVTTIPEAQVPRSELTSEKNAEVLLRAEKAKADMEIAGTERGGRFFQEQPGTGSTQEVTGMKSATADWYRELTSGPSPAIRGDRKQSAREKIEVAIAKIIKDQGADRGKAVEQVKAALLKDQEFHRTEWGRDLASILEGEWPSYMQKPAQPLSNTKELQATENTQPLQNVPKRTTKENGEVYENMPNLREKSGRNAGAPNGFILSPMQGNENEEVQGNPSVDQGTAGQDERQELRSRLQGQGEDTQKAVPEMRLGEGGNASRGLQQADAGGMAVQALSSGTSQPNKVAKVPLSRTERLAQQKQKMEEKKPLVGSDNSVRDHSQRASITGDTITITSYVGNRKAGSITIPLDEWTRTEKGPSANPNYNRHQLMKKYASFLDDQSGGPDQAQRIRDSMERAIQKALATSTKPEPSPSETPRMEPQPATASPERAPAQPTSEAAPKTQEPEGEPFPLTAPEPSSPENDSVQQETEQSPSSFLNDERGSIPASWFTRDKTATGAIDPPVARERLNASKASLRPYLLGALGLEQLSQVYGKDHAEVRQYNKATQDMEADFTEMSRDSDKVARAWTDLNIPVADKMAKVMEDARFLNFDPDPKKNQEADSVKKQELVKRFDQLPDDAKAVYRMARDFYTNMAEQRFQALKERIERAGGTPENTRKLVDRLQLAYEKVRSKVYFPFTRFGENIVVAKQMKDGKEVDREVHAFESVAEAQKFATMMKLKGWTVKQTVAREYSVDKEGPASKIVRQMHDIIKELGQGQQGLPGVMDLENQLLDSLNQSFLQALPDMSYAKHFIHAKDVKGASRDALRSFAHSALHGAHHISRIRHADKVTQALMGLDEKINETTEGDTTEARQVYNELVKRHNDIMNPNTHPVSAWLGQLGFTMSLGGVVATGITNATQVPLVTYPWLGARYGFGKASAALARAYKDFLNPRTLNKDSLFDATKSKLISESERKMLLELARRGHIDLTQTMDLAGLSSRDNLSRKARTLGTVGEKVTRMLGFTFHVPEVMNRQVTALSTFRLEKSKEGGASFEEALEKAQQAIQDTHFIYQSFNRPRYMQGNFLRVLTMFKQYSQNIAYTYGRAASIWLDKNNATKEERTVAKRQLASMLVLQFGAAGALGMPFFGTPVSLIMHALGAMDDDDEDRDWEVAFRKWLDGQATSLAEAFMNDKEKAREVGKEMAEVVSHGASRLTPWDMAGRLGQSDLFFREPQREREGRSAVMDWMMALGGPVPSYGVNFMLGMGDVAKGISELNAGFFMRGVEEMTPAVLRHGVKSLRYTLEGVRTRDEYKQLDLNTSEKLGQAFGFTPSRVAEMYESTTAVKNREHRIVNQQKALKDRFARAVDDQDDKAKQNILDDIRGFNERNPMFAITSNTLNRSLKSRRQHEAGMERGMFLPPKRRALLEEGDWGDF